MVEGSSMAHAGCRGSQMPGYNMTGLPSTRVADPVYTAARSYHWSLPAHS